MISQYLKPINYMLKQTLILATLTWALTTISEVCKPWGIRLYLGDSYMYPNATNDLRIVFNTDNACKESFLELDGKRVDCITENTTIVPINYTIHTHSCEVKLEFTDDVYEGNYTAVGKTGTGEEVRRESIQMRVPRKDISKEFDVLVLGDWGELDEDAHGTVDDILPHISKVIDNPRTVAALFMGDLAYDLCDEAVGSPISCQKYKPMMIAAELITTKVPFMPVLGNHQYDAKKHILSKQLIYETYMVPSGNIEQYSFEIGDIRFQAFNPYDQIFQNDFSRTDDKIKNLTEDSQKKGDHINWLIPFSHYPVYCNSYDNNAQCMNDTYNIQMARFIDYFHEAGVQVYVGAHIHQYRRTKPMRLGATGSFKQSNGKVGVTYTELNDSIVYIIEGAAGNSDFMELKGSNLSEYEASQVPNSGYMLISSSNDKRITFTHYFGKNATIADQFTISNAKEDEWKIALILSLSEFFFIAILGLMIWLVFKHKPVRKHSEITENLISRTEVEV